MSGGTSSNVGVQTTVSMLVTKNSDFSYNIVSGDSTNAAGWVLITNGQDWYEALTNVKNPVWNEILRQILQI
jgi:hypothetical protein